MRRLVLLLPLLAACRGPASEVPSIQDSAIGEPRTKVSLNRVLSGRYRAIAPACVAQQYRIGADGIVAAGGLPMHPGDVVEFRNYLIDVPTNVTGISTPAPLYSPNLVAPYNVSEESGEAFVFWRYALPKAGVYEYFDTNLGEPGRKIVDSYYGTVTYVGEAEGPRGVVCVDAPACVASPDCLAGRAPEGTPCCVCAGVCCTTDAECSASTNCLRGRCVDPAAE